MCVNLFCTSVIIYPSYILNNSYSWISVWFCVLFTSLVSSRVTSSTFHMFFALLYWDTQKNLSKLSAYVMMFLSNIIILSFPLFIFYLETPWFINLIITNNLFSNKWFIRDNILNSLVNWFHKNVHTFFLKLVIVTINI